MRLSEAIRLGSLAIQEPRAGDIAVCAIGMATEAIGQREPLISGKRKSGMFWHWNLATVIEQWPWTEIQTDWRGHGEPYWHQVINRFDNEVMIGAMTIEQLCDTVAMWEDELAAKGINVEQVTMIATPETIHQPDSEHMKVLCD